MKTLLLPILTVGLLASSPVFSQDMTINLTGDANTEQSSKLELLRILQERMNKLTVGQMNSRVIVSTGVKSYYKVGEMVTMFNQMVALRTQLTTEAGDLAKANAGFGQAGNNFVWTYMRQFNEALGVATSLRDQLKILLKDGKPIALPPLPTFNISPPSSGSTYMKDYMDSMNGIIAKYGIKQPGDENNLPADQKTAFDAEIKAANEKFNDGFSASVKQTNMNSLKIVGNVVGAFFGVPGAGNLVAGLISGGSVAAALSGLVGTIVDKFQVPDEYFDSETLKLTDSERLKMIDELHSRMAESLQKGIALRANMNSEVKKRYDNISQPRNEMILYGPKK